jgi:hypothetical protein
MSNKIDVDEIGSVIKDGAGEGQTPLLFSLQLFEKP